MALVDLDLCLGDADVFLDTIPDYTLVDVAQNVTRLDFSLLKRSLTKHSSGVYLLPRPVQLEDVGLVGADDLQRVIGLLKATFTHLVLDLSKGYTPIDLVALEMATHILLVTQLDLPCLRNVVRLMMSFGQMERDRRQGEDRGQPRRPGERPDHAEEGGRDDRQGGLLAASQRLPHDDRGPQQRHPGDRAVAEGGGHPVDGRPWRPTLCGSQKEPAADAAAKKSALGGLFRLWPTKSGK